MTQMSNVARNEIASPRAGNYLSQMSSDVKYFFLNKSTDFLFYHPNVIYTQSGWHKVREAGKGLAR